MGADALELSGSWGVFGGTFDPIHYGHLAVAQQVREALDLDGVLFVPAGVPPHKVDRAVSESRHRVAMVELAIADNAGFRSSRAEVDRPGPSYTIDTLRILSSDLDPARGDAPQSDRLVLIVSVEALDGFEGWREPEAILRHARVVAVPRPGHDRPTEDWLSARSTGQEGRFTFLDGPWLDISSSDIRRRAAVGRSIRYLVPDAVVRYIEEHHLYLPGIVTTLEGGS